MAVRLTMIAISLKLGQLVCFYLGNIWSLPDVSFAICHS